METCDGCKYLIKGDASRLCTAGGGENYRVNPITGDREYYHMFANGSVLPPTTYYMLRVGAPCGPDRQLYKPSIWQRIKDFFSKTQP